MTWIAWVLLALLVLLLAFTFWILLLLGGMFTR